VNVASCYFPAVGYNSFTDLSAWELARHSPYVILGSDLMDYNRSYFVQSLLK